MKLALALVSLALLSGCIVPRNADKLLPEGHANKAMATVTGKFSNTNVEADNYVKTADKVTADRLHLKHSNAWVPNVEITFEGYERDRTPNEK